MRKKNCYSGIGGQAVLEGIMMKNQEKYAIAVRKPDGEIAVSVEHYQGPLQGNRLKKLPLLRGVFSFVESLILGTKALNHSASFWEEEELDGHESSQNSWMILTTVLSVVLALGFFVVLPYGLSALLGRYVRSHSLLLLTEGLFRLLIFLLYVWGISAMKDIRRLYQYHGAEHKCINCIECGRELTVHNVMESSRLHKRCGTSFLFFVMMVSILLFFFIRVQHPVERICLRVLLMPVVAGISYEIIRLAGRSDNFLIRLLSEPGMWIQRITTREPDERMVEVAIVAVESVFDWKQYQQENLGVPREGEKTS